MKKLILGIPAVASLIVGISTTLPVQTRTQPAVAAFDHSNCQYPERWTNPPDGCDNSDPAVPECTKDMYSQEAEKQCQDAFVEANKGTAEKREAIAEHNKPFIKNSVQCGGK